MPPRRRGGRSRESPAACRCHMAMPQHMDVGAVWRWLPRMLLVAHGGDAAACACISKHTSVRVQPHAWIRNSGGTHAAQVTLTDVTEPSASWWLRPYSSSSEERARTGARGGQCHHGAVTAEAAHGLYHGRVGVPLQPLCEAVQPVGAL